MNVMTGLDVLLTGNGETRAMLDAGASVEDILDSWRVG
jgi:hypothetical protein